MAVTTERMPVSEIQQPGLTKARKLAWPDWPRQKIISASFRLVAFGAALLQMGAFPNGPGYNASELVGLAAAAGTYTILKIAQPFKWQQAPVLNVVLLTIDMTVSALLVRYSGSIESPFILYTLLPVLNAALLRGYKVTILVSLITAAYVLAGNVYNPVSHNTLTLQAVNDFLVYIMALGLVAVLPYSMNLSVSRQLRSSAAAEERLHISRDLHDGVCQALCGLRWQVQHLADGAKSDARLSEKLKKMETAVDAAERGARELLEVLHNFSADSGFIAVMNHHLEQFKRDTGIDYECS